MRKALWTVSMLLLPATSLRSQQAGSQHFPPIHELLGTAAQTSLPRGKTDLRDSLGAKPTFKQTIRALTSLNAKRRRAAVRRLGKAGQVRGIPYLGAVLLRSNADAKTRADAAMSLGKIGHWKAVPILEESLGDPSVNVRFASALALGHVPAEDAVSLLADTGIKDTHWWVRYAATVALGDTKSPAAVPALAEVLAHDLRWQVRQQAARSLARFKGKRVVGLLDNALEDLDPSVRYSAAKSLGEIGGLDSLDALHDALERERDPLARGAIRSALERVVRN
jgi:HEAT repeat protein